MESREKLAAKESESLKRQAEDLEKRERQVSYSLEDTTRKGEDVSKVSKRKLSKCRGPE